MSSLPDCSKLCMSKGVGCPVDTCRYWIDYEKENNCSLVSVELNGPMSLVQIAERLNLSFVRISQIENKVKKKLRTNKDLLNLLIN
jgi:transcriptional regulator with XRE-family HTH domain